MYKIIQNNKIIDVVRYPRYVNFLKSGHIALTDKTSAAGIVGSDDETIYSFQQRVGYQTVSIEEITSKEFERLQSLLNSGQEVSANEEVLTNLRQSAIQQLSEQCNNKITSGFSVLLSDNEVYNFKLTIEDQLNLMAIEGQLNTGAETFIYHATNQPCKLFSKEDMQKIINTFRRHVIYHTTYFNTAKCYINSLVDPEKISKFIYGDDLSEVAENANIKQILRNGGSLV